MAIRGQKPKATQLRLVTGNAGHRPIPEAEPVPEGSPIKPKKLKGRPAKLWEEVIAIAFWLSAADGYKLHIWCELQAEFESSPAKMVSARISQLRAIGSELGLDPSSRARLGQGDAGKPKEKADKYF